MGTFTIDKSVCIVNCKSYIKFENNIVNFTVWFLVGSYQITPILLYVKGIANLDLYNEIIKKLRQILLKRAFFRRGKFHDRTEYSFFFFKFLITYSYRAPFYHNTMKAQWQGSLTKQRKNRSKTKFSTENPNICFLCFVKCVQFYNWYRQIFIKGINTLYKFLNAQNMSNKNKSQPPKMRFFKIYDGLDYCSKNER